MKRLALAVLLLSFFLVSCKEEGREPNALSPNIPVAPYAVFSEGLISDISPEGWVKEILQRQKDGLTGHPEAMSYPFDSCCWAGNLEMSKNPHYWGSDWWRFEQSAYYVDGFTRLGYILDDEKLIAKGKANVEYVLDHPLPAMPGYEFDESSFRGFGFASQITNDPRAKERETSRRAMIEKRKIIAAAGRPEGRLGREGESMGWPFAVFFRAIKTYYEATGDPRVPIALEKNYLTYTPEELSESRYIINIEGILWTYSLTGNPKLLELAEAVWALVPSHMEQYLSDRLMSGHGVTLCETLKLPMLLYAYTGKEIYKEAALKGNKKMEDENMLIDGIISSSEGLAGVDALASHETCDISDYTWTMGYFLMVTGDASFADRIEKAIFNAGFGAITKDFKAMQYFSCPNQFLCTGNSNHNEYKKAKTWMAYRSAHEVECCIGNLHRYFPNYASRMWLKDSNGQPVAALYGPSSVVYDLGDGVTVSIQEITNYPFEDDIQFKFTFYENGKLSKKSHNMDFTYRIPSWCDAYGEQGFKTVSKSWKSGEKLLVKFPMEIEFVKNAVQGESVVRGPLTYTYAIPAHWELDTLVYDYLAGKHSKNPDFVDWNITPSGKWNYAIREAELDKSSLIRTHAKGFPFDLENVPLKIRIPVVGVKDWNLDVIPSKEYEGERFTQWTNEQLYDKDGNADADGDYIMIGGKAVQLIKAGSMKYYPDSQGNYGRVRDAFNQIFEKNGKWYCSWEMEDAYITPALPETVVPEENSETFIDLVPYGASTIRLTVFPVY
ncbi:MAG: glycoside hydrolase family 127 protein [Bacteroidales bacterium]|nr:glycoside hydrolase family 127 protein [Bacteroidales bacterium]